MNTISAEQQMAADAAALLAGRNNVATARAMAGVTSVVRKKLATIEAALFAGYSSVEAWLAANPAPAPTPTPTPVPTPTPTPAPTPAAGPLFGINDHDLMWGPSVPTSELTGLGAKVHRCDLGAEAEYNTAFNSGDCLGTFGCPTAVGAWSSALRAAGIQPMLVITFTSLPNATVFAADLAALVKAVPGLWIEIGNELDGTSATAYVPVFAAVVVAAHAADPTCKIGPAPVANINADGSGWNWYKAAFGAGLAGVSYDFLPFHNYPWPGAISPSTAWAGGDSAETLIPQFTAQCTAWGNKAPYWLTEFGWQSTDSSATPNMTPALQSSYVTAFMQAITGDGLPVVIAYELGDGGGQTYGFMTAGWAVAKPVYSAVADLLGVE